MVIELMQTLDDSEMSSTPLAGVQFGTYSPLGPKVSAPGARGPTCS